MKKADGGCKDPENRSKKDCICGGHNHSNAKSNKNHNSTRTKLSIRAQRLFKWVTRKITIERGESK